MRLFHTVSEGFFSETGLPVLDVPGNLISGIKAFLEIGLPTAYLLGNIEE